MATYKSSYTGSEIDAGIANANTAIQDVLDKQDKIDSSHKLSADLISNGSTNKVVTQSEKKTWSGKQDALVSGTNIKTINNESILGNGNITISGGDSTDVKINGTSITSGGEANIVTETAYDASTNKIATMSDVPDVTNYVTNTDYATSSVGGVLKVSNGDYGMVMDEGVLKGAVKTVSQYENMSSKGMICKGTLENVLTDKDYQEELVSGTNIKTINNQNLLGSGNIDIAGSNLPISFSTTQPPLDGSVVLWINADAEEPVVDEFTAFTLAGTCTNLSVEDQTELYSRQYQANATGTNSLYNIIGVKNGSTPISKVEVSSISSGSADFLVVGCNLSATGQGDLSTLLLYGVSMSQNMGFEIPVRGTTKGQYSNNPTVEGTFSDKTKAYIFESRAVTGGFKVTATRVDTGELEVTYTYTNLHATYVPCFGFGRNTSGNIAWKFKKVV